MYAVVVTGGKQYRVSEGTTLVVDRVAAEVGSELALDQVLMVGGENVVVGAPTIPGAVVTATVAAHVKGAKTESMRYLHRQRRRKQKNGRASLSVLQINSIQA
ncbi:MAG: 50S ribosomal protein L21 [Pseudomonadota bacterium]|nr:50S ribosomal protein L21 [Pseudomonadota bacterium]